MNRSSVLVGSVVGFALSLAAGTLLAVVVVTPASALTVRSGTSGGTGSRADVGAPPGTYQSTYYETTRNGDPIRFSGDGDNLIDIFNPTRANNTLCAMFYVFDADQELGECCGCPITSNGLLAESIEGNLTDNWEVSVLDTGAGVVEILDALPNNPGCADHASSDNNFNSVSDGKTTVPACNIAPEATISGTGCDPSLAYAQTPNLSGYITHNQDITPTISLTEVDLQDEGAADGTEQNFLTAACGDILGNGTGTGFCSCVPEHDD